MGGVTCLLSVNDLGLNFWAKKLGLTRGCFIISMPGFWREAMWVMLQAVEHWTTLLLHNFVKGHARTPI